MPPTTPGRRGALDASVDISMRPLNQAEILQLVDEATEKVRAELLKMIASETDNGNSPKEVKIRIGVRDPRNIEGIENYIKLERPYDEPRRVTSLAMNNSDWSDDELGY